MIKDIEILEKVQHKATKWVNNLKSKSYAEQLELLHLTIWDGRQRRDLIEVCKIIEYYIEYIDTIRDGSQ